MQTAARTKSNARRVKTKRELLPSSAKSMLHAPDTSTRDYSTTPSPAPTNTRVPPTTVSFPSPRGVPVTTARNHAVAGHTTHYPHPSPNPTPSPRPHPTASPRPQQQAVVAAAHMPNATGGDPKKASAAVSAAPVTPMGQPASGQKPAPPSSGHKPHPLRPNRPAAFLEFQSPPKSNTVLVTRACPAPMRNLHQEGEWGLDDFLVHRKVGSGKLSDVYQATCKRSGLPVAIKIYHRALMQELNEIQLEREIGIHSRLEHVNIVRLYLVFEDAQATYLVQEYCPRGDVFVEQRRIPGRVYSERECVQKYIWPCLQALQYIHSLGIIHRDIKPENLLLTADGTLRMADFGLAIDALEERPQTRLGTLYYMSPEVLMCPDRRVLHSKTPPTMVYNGKVDAWAVGILAFELMTGRSPFEMSTRDATCALIVCGPLKLPPHMSMLAQDFLHRALHKCADQRMTTQQMLDHPWVVQYCDRCHTPKGFRQTRPARRSITFHGKADAAHAPKPAQQEKLPLLSASYSNAAATIAAAKKAAQERVAKATSPVPKAATKPGSPKGTSAADGSQELSGGVHSPDVENKGATPGVKSVNAAPTSHTEGGITSVEKGGASEGMGAGGPAGTAAAGTGAGPDVPPLQYKQSPPPSNAAFSTRDPPKSPKSVLPSPPPSPKRSPSELSLPDIKGHQMAAEPGTAAKKLASRTPSGGPSMEPSRYPDGTSYPLSTSSEVSHTSEASHGCSEDEGARFVRLQRDTSQHRAGPPIH